MKKMPLQWTPDRHRFLADNYLTMTDRQLSKKLGISCRRIYTRRLNYGFMGGAGRDYTEQECELIKQHYPTATREQLEEQLPGRPYYTIKVKARELGISRPNTARFKPRHVIKKTQHGTLTIWRLGARSYCVLVTNAGYTLYHRYLWEKQNGPIPQNHLLRCRTLQTQNPDPSNWEMITKSENASRNQDHIKAMQTMQTNGTLASVALSDKFIAGILAPKDPELKEHLIKHHPDLIRTARANHKLKRKIRTLKPSDP